MGARFVTDTNKVGFFFESGTYGNPSGIAGGIAQWPGEVTESALDDAENLLVDRFLGANTRSVAQWVGGPREITGTLTYHPTDMLLAFQGIGSVNDGGTAGHYTHDVNQINTNAWQCPFTSGTGTLNGPFSFTLEDSKTTAGSGFIRTVNGVCLDKITISSKQGEKVEVSADWIGKTLTYSGGITTTTVINSGTTPYLWSNCAVTLSGLSATTAKEFSLEINQNLEAPHYLNNSRDISAPIPGPRENTLSVTLDLDSQVGNTMYEIYKNNASFNSIVDMNADVTTGSQHTIFFLSGCKVNTMDVPSTNDIGVNETTVEIVCPTIIGSAIDTIVKYNPW